MPNKMRVGVLGSGFAASTYAEAIKYVPDAELVAIAGGRNATELANQFGVRALATSEIDGLLDSDWIDAVMIASPNPFHAPQAIRAAKSGKHALVEKPMGMNVAECRAMVDAARASGVTLMPGHHHRYRRNPVAARLLLDRGIIGKIDMAWMNLLIPDETSWLNTPANGGYLLGGGVHGFDVLRWLVGDVTRVTALTGQYRGVQVENGAVVMLEFANGAHGAMQNAVIPGLSTPAGSGVARFDVDLTGQTGALSVDMYGDVRLSTQTGWSVQTSLPVWDGHYAFLRVEAYAQLAREFIAASRGQLVPRVNAEDGLIAVAIVEAAHRSAAERSWVDLASVLG